VVEVEVEVEGVLIGVLSRFVVVVTMASGGAVGLV